MSNLWYVRWLRPRTGDIWQYGDPHTESKYVRCKIAGKSQQLAIVQMLELDDLPSGYQPRTMFTFWIEQTDWVLKNSDWLIWFSAKQIDYSKS